MPRIVERATGRHHEGLEVLLPVLDVGERIWRRGRRLRPGILAHHVGSHEHFVARFHGDPQVDRLAGHNAVHARLECVLGAIAETAIWSVGKGGVHLDHANLAGARDEERRLGVHVDYHPDLICHWFLRRNAGDSVAVVAPQESWARQESRGRIALLALAASAFLACRQRPSECPCRVALDSHASGALATYRLVWWQSPTVEHGLALLRALRDLGVAIAPVEREVIAAMLLAAHLDSAAHVARGEIRQAANDLPGARGEFEAACAADEKNGDQKSLARNASRLAGVCRDQRDFAAARIALARSRRAAEVKSDARMIRHVDLLDGDLDRLTGDYASADATLRRLERTADRTELPWLHFKYGMLYMAWEKLELAKLELEVALRSAADSPTERDVIIAAAHAN